MRDVDRLILLIAISGFHVTVANLKCDCSRVSCVEPVGCRVGVQHDMCKCCMVCAKEEGEVCGGLNHVEGECGDAMQCIVRRLRSGRNRMKQSVGELVGRCEYVKCHFKRCPFGQVCTLVNSTPTCVCPLCKDMDNGPVCGRTNNKQYKNECDLRREECLASAEIGMHEGSCKELKLTNVKCDTESMRIEVSKSFFGKTNGIQFTLLDETCKFQENTTHIYRSFRLTECMTRVTHTLTSTVYSNILMSLKRLPYIKAKHVQLPFECEYSLKNVDQSALPPHGEVGNRAEDKMRANSVGAKLVEKMPTRKYRSVNAGMKVDVNHIETYLIQMQSRSFAKYNALLSPSFCYASPIERSQRWMKYIFIRRGCPIENGVEILEAQSPFIKMTVPSITFREARFPGILVKCRVRACFPKSPKDKSLCEPRCPLSNHIRRRRDLNSKNEPIIIEYEMTEHRMMT